MLPLCPVPTWLALFMIWGPVEVSTNNAHNQSFPHVLCATPENMNKHIRSSKAGWHHPNCPINHFILTALGSNVVRQSKCTSTKRQWCHFFFFICRDQINPPTGWKCPFIYTNVTIFICTAGKPLGLHLYFFTRWAMFLLSHVIR